MNRPVDLYDAAYRNPDEEVLARVRRNTFGTDIGQNSWTTAAEYQQWAEWLQLTQQSHVLEVACGSGGPAIYLAEVCGARITGVDVNPHGVAAGRERAVARGLGGRVDFQEANAEQPLPFPDATFDAVICIDAANHLPRRDQVLRDWHRVLRPGSRLLFTDPVVVTGLVTQEELTVRASIGCFVFAPPGINEGLIESAGFELVRREDRTASAADIAARWHAARADDREALVRIEAKERFDGLQRFFAMVHRLATERRLSRYAYLAHKREIAEAA